MTLAGITAFGIGPTAAPPLADVAGPGAGAGIINFPGLPRNFWESSVFGLLLLILAFGYVTGRLLKG